MDTLIQNIFAMDAAPIKGKPVKSPEGFLTAVVNATRIGIMEYDSSNFGMAPGKILRVLRLPEDVFKPESMETLKGRPVTNHHPPELLDTETAPKYMVGSTGSAVARDGDFLQTSISVYDAQTIDDIEAGLTEVSCGYLADVLQGGGVHPQYGQYDLQQVNIRHNHLAVGLEAGRGGSNVKVLMDSAITPKQEKTTMSKKISIGDKEYEVSQELGDAFGKHMDEFTKKHTEEMDALKKELEGLKKKQDDCSKDDDDTKISEDDDEDLENLADDDDDLDLKKWAEEEEKEPGHKDKAHKDSLKGKDARIHAIAAKVDKLKAQRNQLYRQSKTHMDAADPQKMTEALRHKAQVLAVAAQVMDNADINAMFSQSEAEIKKAIVAAREPKVDLKGKSAEFIDGMFEAISLTCTADNVGEVLGAMLMDNADTSTQHQAPAKWEKPKLTASKTR